MKLFCWTRCKVLENVSLWSWLLAWSYPSIYGLISCNHCEEISNIIYCMLGCWQSIQCWRCVWFLRWVDKLAYVIFIFLGFRGMMTKVKTIAFDLAKLSVVVGCLEISWYWIRKGHADLFLIISRISVAEFGGSGRNCGWTWRRRAVWRWWSELV